MNCPNCNSEMQVQVVNQVDLKVKNKGCIWWLFIGWWWIPIKWLFFFWIALIVKLLKGKQYKAVNRIKKIAVCSKCGYSKEI